MQLISIVMHPPLSFQLNSDFKGYMNPSLWSQTNGMILGLDELINAYARLGIHRLDSCISNGDLVRPLYKLGF